MVRSTAPKGQIYYWVTGRKKNGKMTLLGPYGVLDRERAESDMFDAFPNDTGQVHTLNTSDRQAATSQLKYYLFNETRDLDSSMANISHMK